MTAPTLTPAQRKAFKADAHPLHPVVIIGDAGLTPSVLKEIDVSLKAHSLIKVRVVGDDREARIAIYGRICEELEAAPVQHIGKLLVIYRPSDEPEPAPLRKPTKRDVKKTRRETIAKRNPISGRLMVTKTSTRKPVAGTRPPRTERVRKSGQKSAKKPFQEN